MGQGPDLISAAVCRSGSSTSEPDAPAESESESDMGTSWYCVSSAAGDAAPAPLPDACEIEGRLCLGNLLEVVEIQTMGTASSVATLTRNNNTELTSGRVSNYGKRSCGSYRSGPIMPDGPHFHV